jgi:hypothetical protein
MHPTDQVNLWRWIDRKVTEQKSMLVHLQRQKPRSPPAGSLWTATDSESRGATGAHLRQWLSAILLHCRSVSGSIAAAPLESERILRFCASNQRSRSATSP